MIRPLLFIDLETRSACDLPLRGGWNYADDPTTRLLTVAWRVDGVDHVWMPGVIDPIPDDYRQTHLPNVIVHTGAPYPEALLAETGRAWVAHNGDQFDSVVWRALMPPEFQPAEWLDTLPRCLAIGLPGNLDRIGQMLWGEGKYKSGKEALKKASRATGEDDCEPINVPLGQTILVARYNVQDVGLMADLWTQRIAKEYKPTEHEARVLRANVAMNNRGCRVDRGMTVALAKLADESKHHAVRQIKELTKDDSVRLESAADIQSRTKMFAWLGAVGVSLGSSLRKDIVARFIEAYSDEDEPDLSDADDDERGATNLARTVKVLELRMQALRITGGKLDAALWALGVDHAARGLFAYWGAHTGRWAGRKIQVQNLPRPKPGIDTWALVKLYEETGKLDYDAVAALLPLGNPLYRFLSVDDAASAMLRSIFIPSSGRMLAAADLSQIEARVLAWLADESWLMNAFWSGDDPYIRMAEALLGPKEGWPVYPDEKGKPLPYKKHPYRQIVGKVPSLACGYQGGDRTVGIYAANMGFNLEDFGVTPLAAVNAWRRLHPKIAGEEAGEYKGRPYFKGGIWDQLDDAAVLAVERGGPVTVQGKVTFQMFMGTLVVTLPSGRRMVYRGATIEKVDRFGTGRYKKTVTFTHPRYGRKRTYGGYWAENVVQAIARDVIAVAMVRHEEQDMPVCLTVHDEDAASIMESQFAAFMAASTVCPDWLTDFPLDAEGGIAPRYAKSPPPGRKDQTWRNGRPL